MDNRWLPFDAFEGNAYFGGAYGVGYEGSKWAWVGGYDNTIPGYIEQTVTGFTVGNSYTLSFLLAAEYSDTSDGVHVAIGGASTIAADFDTVTVANNGSGGGLWNSWQGQSWTFIADAASLTFRITGTTGPYDAAVDNFQLSEAAVPEPSTYIAGALLLLPFGAQTVRRLRNRRQLA